jgi:hypothetical protein
MFYMGFDGTEVTPQIRTLIEDHHLGSILLTTKNLKCKFKHSSSIWLRTHSEGLITPPGADGVIKLLS